LTQFSRPVCMLRLARGGYNTGVYAASGRAPAV
jgi:hypothetical protein